MMIRLHATTCLLVSTLLTVSTAALTYLFFHAKIGELKAEISRLENAADVNRSDNGATDVAPHESFQRRTKQQLRSRNTQEGFPLDGYFELLSDDARGGCLAIRNSDTRDGNSLHLATCDFSDPASYQWRYDSDGLLHSRLDDDKCMQAGHGDTPGHATRMRLYRCDRNNELQHFTYHDEERIELTGTNLCVVFRGINGNLDSDPIILKACDDAERQDNWIYPGIRDRGIDGIEGTEDEDDGDDEFPRPKYEKSFQDMQIFVNEFLAELQGLADETNRFSILTEELGTIASSVDTRRHLQHWLAGYYQTPQSDVDSDQNQDNSDSLLININDFGGINVGLNVVEQDSNGLGVEQQDTIVLEQMNTSLRELENQRNLVSTSNGLMMELNGLLRSSIFDLNDQKSTLQTSVDNLSTENQRLHNERSLLLREIEVLNGNVTALFSSLQEHERLNERLEASIRDLDRQNQILDDSNIQYAALNAQLNESLSELQSQNEFLAQQNNYYAGLNTDLNVTSGILAGEVDNLAAENNDLEAQNNRLTALVASLNDEINTLSDLNSELNETARDLRSDVDRLSEENSRLEATTNELSSIVSFLNETALNTNESFDAVTNFISEQIASYRSVVLETLQNTYIQRVANWDCSFRDVFRNQGFVNNGAVQIPGNVYAEVMNYIDDRIFSNLCLDIEDFQNYLEDRFNERPSTMNHLISGVEGYTTAALNYYFPDEDEEDEGGLTMEDWATAGFACDNLGDLQFSFDESTI